MIKLFSQDPELLRQWAPKVGDAIKKIHGVVDVLNGIDNTISGPAVVFHVDPGVAARAGFTPEEVELDASAILQGEPAATPVVVNDRAYTIRVRFPDDTRSSLEAIRNTLLSSQPGRRRRWVRSPRIEELPGQTEIRRENLQRDVAVTARLEGLDLGTGIAEVQKAVATDWICRPGFAWSTEAAMKSSRNQFHDLVVVLMLAVVLVFIVLLFEFGSFRRSARDSCVGAAFHFRRVSGAAGHRDHVQYFVVHGTDHGDRHCGQERHSAAGCGSEVPRAKAPRRRTP